MPNKIHWFEHWSRSDGELTLGQTKKIHWFKHWFICQGGLNLGQDLIDSFTDSCKKMEEWILVTNKTFIDSFIMEEWLLVMMKTFHWLQHWSNYDEVALGHKQMILGHDWRIHWFKNWLIYDGGVNLGHDWKIHWFKNWFIYDRGVNLGDEEEVSLTPTLIQLCWRSDSWSYVNDSLIQTLIHL